MPEPERWWGRHLHELRWQLEAARLLADPVFYGRGVPRGDGRPVLLLPGLLAGHVLVGECRLRIPSLLGPGTLVDHR